MGSARLCRPRVGCSFLCPQLRAVPYTSRPRTGWSSTDRFYALNFGRLSARTPLIAPTPGVMVSMPSNSGHPLHTTGWTSQAMPHWGFHALKLGPLSAPALAKQMARSPDVSMPSNSGLSLHVTILVARVPWFVSMPSKSGRSLHGIRTIRASVAQSFYALKVGPFSARARGDPYPHGSGFLCPQSRAVLCTLR